MCAGSTNSELQPTNNKTKHTQQQLGGDCYELCFCWRAGPFIWNANFLFRIFWLQFYIHFSMTMSLEMFKITDADIALFTILQSDRILYTIRMKMLRSQRQPAAFIAVGIINFERRKWIKNAKKTRFVAKNFLCGWKEQKKIFSASFLIQFSYIFCCCCCCHFDLKGENSAQPIKWYIKIVVVASKTFEAFISWIEWKWNEGINIEEVAKCWTHTHARTHTHNDIIDNGKCIADKSHESKY